MRRIVLEAREPLVTFSTNDSHIFSLCKNSREQKELCLNSLNVGYSISKIDKNRVYECYLKVNPKNHIQYKDRPKEIFDNKNVFVEYIFNCLNRGVYLILDLDVSNVNEYRKLNNGVKIHSPLVTGVDSKRNLIELSDFFDFKRYEKKWIDIDSVYKGYKVFNTYFEEYPIPDRDEWIRTTSHLTYIKSEFNYKKIFKENLVEYISGTAERKHGCTSDYHLVVQRLNSIIQNYDVSQKIPILEEMGSGISFYDFFRKQIKETDFSSSYNLVQSALLLNKHLFILKKCIYFIQEEGNINLHLDKCMDVIEINANFLKFFCMKLYFSSRDTKSYKVSELFKLINTIEGLEIKLIKKIIEIL